MNPKKTFAKNNITEQFLQDKSSLYELSSGEQELIDLSSRIIEDLLEDIKYINEEKKRILNDKLNQDEIIDELREETKRLKRMLEDK